MAKNREPSLNAITAGGHLGIPGTTEGREMHTCMSQCDKCHTLENCVQAVTRIGDLLLCAACARKFREG